MENFKKEITISEVVARMKSRRQFKTREFQQFSFGSESHCKCIFIKAMMEYDPTITKLIWLPEYDQIINWMTNTRGKGLALVGSNGLGKTDIICGVLPIIFYTIPKVLSPILALTINPRRLTIIESKWAIAIDDIGQEKVINDYGTPIDAVERLISICEAESKLLFITTNLNQEQLKKRYGSRITDRINRLCRVVEFSGKSFRK